MLEERSGCVLIGPTVVSRRGPPARLTVPGTHTNTHCLHHFDSLDHFRFVLSGVTIDDDEG